MTYTEMKKTLFIVAAALAITMAGCSGKEKMMHLSGIAQGSYYAITYCDEQGRDLQQSIDSLLDDFDKTASLWKENSLIRRVNDNRDSVVNTLFAELLELSTEMNRLTEGAFDCTVGPLVEAWGFSFRQRKEMNEHEVDSLRQLCGTQPSIVQREDGSLVVRKKRQEMRVDFNAIAQGYASDMVAHFLQQQGIANYIVDIGGEVVAHGKKPDGTKWVVGIEKPAKNRDDARKIETSIQLTDCAVVTSGSYRKYYEKDGERYSHTIDPRTGKPVEHNLLSVTVIDTSAWRADALATAFMVMGVERAMEFIKQHPEDSGTQAVLFISADGDDYKVTETEGMKQLKTNN